MTNKIKTHVGIVLDRSGSMGKIKQQAIDHYNEQLEVAQNNSKEQDITFTLVTFNENVYEHYIAAPVDSVSRADETSYSPLGGTAMWDGICHTIVKMQEATEGDKDAAYLLIVISDGEDNKLDPHYGASAAKEMIDACRATSRWTISYVGCDEKYLHKIHEQSGIPLANMGVWSNSTQKTARESLKRSTKRVNNYYATRSMGLTSSECLYSDKLGAVANFTEESFGESLQQGAESLNDLQAQMGNISKQLTDNLGPQFGVDKSAYLGQANSVSSSHTMNAGTKVTWK